MRLSEVIEGLDIVGASGNGEADITGISYDSRRVKRGHLFAALPGEKADGHDFIDDAIMRGAAAVIHEKAQFGNRGKDLSGKTVKGSGPASYANAAFIRVRDSRMAFALAASNFFNNPSRSLCVTGITGTNGKTTTSYLIKSILESWGEKVGLIGTIQYMIGEKVLDAPHTTPEAPEFQELLDNMRSSGCTHVVSEISSHALAQKRADGTLFKVAIFTNLTRDHLDFHKTMEKYFIAKKRLFLELLGTDGISVINSDDPYGRRLVASLRKTGAGMRSVFTYGLETPADIMTTGIRNCPEGLQFKIAFQGRDFDVVSPLMGLPNVYNILSAAGASVALGVPWDVILDGIRQAGRVTGRFEKVDAGQGFLAVVDYAHTEDALERLIYTARGMTGGKIITVFGCGGNRDRGKRPRMGAVATRLSDFVIITSDNPRTEKPEEIMKEIASGAVRKNYLLEADRREAIRKAVFLAGEQDIVLIAGKGHETYQETGTTRSGFIDREVLEEAIKQLITRQ
jgi:UDP-N-acetylmuramoyl-L-alanyl-D-glutamate--2,6-diaminopimelate ligase